MADEVAYDHAVHEHQRALGGVLGHVEEHDVRVDGKHARRLVRAKNMQMGGGNKKSQK